MSNTTQLNKIKKTTLKNLVINGIGSVPITPKHFFMGFKNGEALSYNLVYSETTAAGSFMKPKGLDELLSKHGKKLDNSEFVLGFGAAENKDWARYEIHLIDEGSTYRVRQVSKLAK